MKTNNLSLQKVLLIFGVPISIFFLSVLLLRSKIFLSNPSELFIGLTLDLLITSPLIYLFLIRKTAIPKLTVVPLFVISLIIGYQIIPESHHSTLDFFKTWFLPVIEISVFTFVLLKIKKIRTSYKELDELDFFHALQKAVSDEFPSKIATAITTEISGVYYGFLHWKKVSPKSNEFTYHKNNGTPALLFVLILIVGVEVFAVHLWIVNYSLIAAWILTLLSVYSGLQLFAFGKSLSKRPYLIKRNEFMLSYGILAEGRFNYEQVDSIEPSPLAIELNEQVKTLSPIGLIDTHNVKINFKDTVTITSLYGTEKKLKSLLIHVDEKEAFIASIKLKLNERDQA